MRLGVIYPSDGVQDREFWDFAPPGCTVHITRVRIADEPLTLAVTRAAVDSPDIVQAADLLRPIGPDAVAYACTAISFALGAEGDAAITDTIHQVSGAPVTTTSAALVAACRALGAARVAVAAPYLPEITDKLRAYLEAAGLGVTGAQSLGLTRGIENTTTDQLFDLGVRAMTPDADAIILSCTNLRTYDVVPKLEERLGKPVITSNLATVWQACRLAGRTHPQGNGRLWRACISEPMI